MARIGWLRGVSGFGLCFVTGCLYHTTTGGEPGHQPAPPVQLAKAEALPPQSSPATLTTYNPAPYRAASAIEPTPSPPTVETVPAPMPTPLPRTIEPPPPEMPPRDKPLVAAMRQVLERHPQEAARELEKEGAKRERLLALLKLTAGVSADEIDKLPPAEAASLLDHLREVSKGLARRAPLEVRKAAFCRSIRGFGQYEPTGESPAFQAGAEGQPGESVQVYAEVGNFATRSAGEDGHETRLAASLEIRGQDGQRLATLPLGACDDRCQSQRHDYFLNCRFHVPAGMKPGTYSLWVTVKDATTGKPREAKASLAFRVVPRVP